MNTEQEQRLEKIFRDNENKGIAIAITGCWGVGKTFFWNNFLKNQSLKEYNHFNSFYYYASKVDYVHIFENKKYAYISLFGIESLDALKNEIAIKLAWNPYSQNIHKHYGIPQLLKNTLVQFKDIKFSHYGVSSSSKLVDSILFAQVKNAIICFDDFERLSEKIKIQDVMGLANLLKLERNCQVVLILCESKTEAGKQKKYAEYKEKLIDEKVKITSVESLLKEKAREAQIDEPLIDLMVKFAKELKIHNFRFFQKVIKLYRQFRGELPYEVVYSTKEIILVRILQGYLIEDFGSEKDLNWSDFSNENAIILMDPPNENELKSIKIQTLRKLYGVSYKFVHDADQWSIEFKKWFDQKGEPDFSKLHVLANSDLISEKNNQIRDSLDALMEEWRNLAINETFCERLYEVARQTIGVENLENLSFYCDLLAEFGNQELSKILQKKVKQWVSDEYELNGYLFVNDQFSFGFKDNNQFHLFLKKLQDQKPNRGLSSLVDVIYHYAEHGGWNSNTDPKVLELATKQDWHNLIFVDFENDKRFKATNKFRMLKKILKQQISIELQPKINALIFELLEDEAQISSLERRKNIEYVIRRLKE